MSLHHFNHPLRRLSLSLVDNITSIAPRSCSSPPVSPLRTGPSCSPHKPSVRLSRKWKGVSSLAVNADIGPGTTECLPVYDCGVGSKPVTSRARSISLFTPHRIAGGSDVDHTRVHEYYHDHSHIVENNSEHAFYCTAPTPASSPVDGSTIAFASAVSITATLAPTSATVPNFKALVFENSMSTSSMAYSSLDRLLKPERQAVLRPRKSSDLCVDTSVPRIPSPIPTASSHTTAALRNNSVPSPLIMTYPNTSFISPQSPSCSQRFKAPGPNEKQRFTCVSPPCIALSPSSSSSESSDSSDGTNPSPTARARRAPSSHASPPMSLQTTTSSYTLVSHLPRSISSEMITISAKKGECLDVVADAWHMEEDCHYAWQVRFAPGDVDMSSVRARFNAEGRLTIEVQRRTGGQVYASKGGWGYKC